jgi:hypothetical protein
MPTSVGILYLGEAMEEARERENDMADRSAGVLAACAEQLAAAASTLEEALGKLGAQYESLNQKVDRIVAAIESGDLQAQGEEGLRERVCELERENVALQVQASGRKTMSALTNSVLAKGTFEGERLEGGGLEKALQALSVEQRIAVKAELARAGMLA